ncbi:MAG: ABC transporter permease [Clostridia bacterium]|nr:ABC transporter permease [Clostridia bacterium]
MKKSLSRTIILTKRNFKEILRDPLSLVFTLGMPLFMEILFYFIFHNLTSQFEMKYLAPGIVVFAESFLSLFVGLLIALDRSTSFLTRLYVSKAKPYEFIFSYALSIVPIVFIQSLLFFLVGGIIDSSIFGIGMILAILISIVPSLFFIGLGILLGTICNEKSIGGISSIVIAGQSVLSGMWFPIEGLNEGIVALMDALPFRNATRLVQNIMNGINDSFQDFILPLIIVLAYTVVSFVVAIILFRRKMVSK